MADLTTLAAVKRYLGSEVEGITSVDAILQDLITESSAWVTTQIGRTFATTTVTEPQDGDGTTRLILKQSPVVSITSVTVGTDPAIPQRPNADAGSLGWVKNGNAVDLVGYIFTIGVQNVVIVYVAGEAVPADLEGAVKERVAFKYRRRQNLGMNSISVANESVSYADAAVLAGIEDVLSHYRALVVG